MKKVLGLNLAEIIVLGWCFAFALFLILSGCAAGPRTTKEMSPVLSSQGDPQEGLIVLEGEPAARIEFCDQAGRVVARWDEAGANPLAPTFNGQRRPRVYVYRMETGNYAVKVRPFYYTANLFLSRQLVELPVQQLSVSVDRRADTCDSQYTGRYWGWVLRINTGAIPRQHFSGPRINISGTGLPGLLIEKFLGAGR